MPVVWSTIFLDTLIACSGYRWHRQRRRYFWMAS